MSGRTSELFARGSTAARTLPGGESEHQEGKGHNDKSDNGRLRRRRRAKGHDDENEKINTRHCPSLPRPRREAPTDAPLDEPRSLDDGAHVFGALQAAFMTW